MINETQEYKMTNNTSLKVLLGILFGGLAGSLTMLLLAPQSGRDTRMQIQKKSIELRDQTTEAFEDAFEQVRSNVNKFALSAGEKFTEVKQMGKKLAVQKLDDVSEAVQSAEESIKKS